MNGSAIRDMRHSLRLSQDALAATLGTSSKSIRDWESGRHKPRSFYRRALERLAERAAQVKQIMDSFDPYDVD